MIADHETLDEAIDAIELLIRRGEHERLRAAAASFAELLKAHFAVEERSAMFTILPAENSVVASKVEILLREHGEMRAEIRAVLASDDLEVGLLALMKRLDAHEKVELTLLENALQRATRE